VLSIVVVAVAGCRARAVGSAGTSAPTRPASGILSFTPPDSDFTSYFSGSTTDVVTKPAGGALLAGGGTDSDDGMRWLLAQGGIRAPDEYGDVVVLRTSGADGYNDYLTKLGANSVTSIVIRSVAGANSAHVRDAIARAEVVFLAGGDQSRYERLWRGTALQAAAQARIDQGYPIGGTSAGLAVLGEYGYSALNESAQSVTVLQDPFDASVTLERSLFTVPHLTNVITDSHFVVRVRMGRLLGFLARLALLYNASAPHGIGIDEKSAVGMSASGSATIIGSGEGAYFLSTGGVTTRSVAQATPLTYTPVTVMHVPVGQRFDLATWTTSDAVPYTLSVVAGVVSSSIGVIY
jgi:cyanophycinase